MRVIKSEENILEFDNGLIVTGDGDVDCCARNYLDFEQFLVGDVFETMTAGQFIDAVTLKEDGFVLRASDGTPKWCQARSDQNGYYSDITTLYVQYDGKTINMGQLKGSQ